MALAAASVQLTACASCVTGFKIVSDPQELGIQKL